jgi:hypothetical protein
MCKHKHHDNRCNCIWSTQIQPQTSVYSCTCDISKAFAVGCDVTADLIRCSSIRICRFFSLISSLAFSTWACTRSGLKWILCNMNRNWQACKHATFNHSSKQRSEIGIVRKITNLQNMRLDTKVMFHTLKICMQVGRTYLKLCVIWVIGQLLRQALQWTCTKGDLSSQHLSLLPLQVHLVGHSCSCLQPIVSSRDIDDY